MMKRLIFIVINLAAVFCIRTNRPGIIDIGEDKDIPEANKGLLKDDILEPPNIQRSAVINEDYLWTSPVPYVLDKSLEMNAKGIILRAFDQFRLKSCIDFKPRDSEDYYISLVKSNGCFSFVGKLYPGGQNVSIGRFCDEISTAEHEVLHALGFNHEQSRYDRDNYLNISFENIETGFESNFVKVSEEESTTNNVPYDYWSVMHYGKNAFSNGNGSTMITKDPEFRDIIGQTYDMSPRDALELNLLYQCNSTIAFKMFDDFSDPTTCRINRCSDRGTSWERVTHAPGGPSSDHTNLPNGSGHRGQGVGYFMHASTASGKEGDSAWLETQRMITTRECHVQCLQFYYFHSGNQFDQLNIWLREFKDEWDNKGTRRLVGQITGRQTSYWQFHHVSLNATKHFQVVFEAHKGHGISPGGFSIDDINLSETKCPQFTLQLDEFEKLLTNTSSGTNIYSPQLYSRGGYSYSFGITLKRSFVGLFIQLVSGRYDDQLEWPCPQRQVTFQMIDQNPNIQLQMSKQRSITSDLSRDSWTGLYNWDNPRKFESQYIDKNNKLNYAGPMLGKSYFANLEEMKYKDFLKGGSAVFVFSFEDLTPLVNGSALPCPKVGPAKFIYPPKHVDKGPCPRISPPHPPPPKTTDGSVFGFAPGLVASPVLTFLLALMFWVP